MRTSASQSIFVPPPSSLRLKAVFMLSIAPTPLPLIARRANSGSRSSVFSMSMVMPSAPSPSGIFTLARQCWASWTSKLSTPGIIAAIAAGSFSTRQTASRGALNARSPATLTAPRG